jgi:hypothetical protein
MATSTLQAQDTALIWDRRASRSLVEIQPERGKSGIRHRRKYGEAELPEDRSFYFRGAEGKLNLRAHNLKLFTQIAVGLDDATWLRHLHRKDYSRWISETLKMKRSRMKLRQSRSESRFLHSESRPDL